MSYLLKRATIIDPGSKLDRKVRDVLIKKGIIVKIAASIDDPKAMEISSGNLFISPGWVDIGCTNCEPGFEHRETIKSLMDAAAAGGYTKIAPLPTSKPAVDNKTAIEFLHSKSKEHPVSILPIGCVSKHGEGAELAELIDMHHHGAVAFSDGQHGITDGGLLLRALQYAKHFDGLVINHPDDGYLTMDAQMHEGETSTRLGLQGLPDILEASSVDRDLELLNYTDSRLLVHNVSSHKAILHLERSTSGRFFVSVPYLNLVKTDEDLGAFDSQLKVSPVLRSEKDRKGLLSALKKDVIHAITSNHVPLESEFKDRAFVNAESGAIGLQTVFSALYDTLGDEYLEVLIKALSRNPRRCLGMAEAHIMEDAPAELTLFDPSRKWTFNAISNKSLSNNSPYWNHTFQSAVLGIFNKNKLVLNNFV